MSHGSLQQPVTTRLCTAAASALHNFMQALDALRGSAGDQSASARSLAFARAQGVLNKPLKPLQGISSLFIYGYSRADPFKQGEWRSDLCHEDLPPVMLANGDLDSLSCSTAEGTLARLPPPKVGALIHDLDHFSLADRRWLPHFGLHSDKAQDSTLDRHEQVQRLCKVACVWFSAMHAAKEAASHGSTDAAADQATAAAEKLQELQELPYVHDVNIDLQPLRD